jgi:hypothetical protein
VGLPAAGDFEQIVAALPAGNAGVGEKLFSTKGCLGCHSTEKGVRMVGPSFYGLWLRAGAAKPPLSARAYLYESMVLPNAYVPEGYQPNIMKQSLREDLTLQDMADLLAWIEHDFAHE